MSISGPTGSVITHEYVAHPIEGESRGPNEVAASMAAIQTLAEVLVTKEKTLLRDIYVELAEAKTALDAKRHAGGETLHAFFQLFGPRIRESLGCEDAAAVRAWKPDEPTCCTDCLGRAGADGKIQHKPGCSIEYLREPPRQAEPSAESLWLLADKTIDKLLERDFISMQAAHRGMRLRIDKWPENEPVGQRALLAEYESANQGPYPRETRLVEREPECKHQNVRGSVDLSGHSESSCLDCGANLKGWIHAPAPTAECSLCISGFPIADGFHNMPGGVRALCWKKAEATGDDPLDSREFYEVMQAYRWAGMTPQVADQKAATEAFDAVKTWLRQQLNRPAEPT